MFGSARRHVVITLTDRIPWTIKISGGTANGHLDLRRLQLAKVEISGGASRMDAQLPSPRGTAVIDVSGGISNLTLRAPADAQWRVAVSGGVSGLRINGSFYAAIGGDFQQESHGYASASDGFDIEISGGASHVDVRTG